MPFRFSAVVVVLAVLAVVPAVSAQGGLTATPNPYDNEAGVSLVIRNATAAPVTLDSLRIASTEDREGPYTGGWGIGYRAYLNGDVVEGGVYCSQFRSGPCIDVGLF
ncbi:MAG TPA: hypothetical protein VF594_00590, partial [Rubricoccaceae bacterium]